MGLVSSIGWLTPPIAVFIAYTYLALEVIGEELEEPFGREGNDLPLAALCHTIESAVREMRGLPVTVEAPKPQGCICTRSRNNKGVRACWLLVRPASARMLRR
jgi:putative membrane protein